MLLQNFKVSNPSCKKSECQGCQPTSSTTSTLSPNKWRDIDFDDTDLDPAKIEAAQEAIKFHPQEGVNDLIEPGKGSSMKSESLPTQSSQGNDESVKLQRVWNSLRSTYFD